MKKVNNYKYFYFLLRYIYTDKEEQEEYKRALISRITDGRTTSLREIDDREYFTLINQLEDIVGIKEKIRKERSATLKLLQKEFNVDTTNWNKVDAICLSKRIAGKPFRFLNIMEHAAVRQKLYSILSKGGFKARKKDILQELQIVIIRESANKKNNINNQNKYN